MNENNINETMKFSRHTENLEIREVLTLVYEALQEKGYDPTNQIVGYIISGDPAYITGYRNARNLMKRIERDELLEELVSNYMDAQK